MRSSICVAAALAACIHAFPAPHVVHEKRDYTPKLWAHQNRAHPASIVPVRIGMTQSNLDRGHDLLMEVSQHDSPKFGQHYTQEEVDEIFAPSAETVDAVRSWLHAAGIAKDRVTQSYNKQWLQFDAEIKELEDLLHTEYHVYEHSHHEGASHVACDEYSVPKQVQHHIDYITPGIKLMKSTSTPRKTLKKRQEREEQGLEKREHQRYKLPVFIKPLPMQIAEVQSKNQANDLSICDSVISPPCIKAMYNITPATAGASPMKRQLGIFEDLGDHYSQADLNLFFKAVYPDIPQGTHPTLNGIDGATGPIIQSEAGPESNLDFSISYPILYPSNSVLFQTDDDLVEDDYVYDGFLNNFFDAIDGSYCTYQAFGAKVPSPLDPPYPDPRPGGFKGQLECGKYEPTNVISISYGGAEIDLPIRYQKRQCSEIMKLGMRGITVIVSSGDYGVAIEPPDPSPNGCLPPSQTKNGTIFAPDFPATCPYITGLGSTYLPPGASATADEEIATTRFGSGGGFSNIYTIPSWQQSAVTGYLKKYPPPYPSYKTADNRGIGANGGIYNSGGRGFPDISAIGDNVLMYYRNRPVLIGGTSAAAPATAAMIARINQERIKAGKSTVGFLNPTFYANPQLFHDITVGNNPGCGTSGFSAEPGWDPLTGLGTPNYSKLLAYYLKQQ